jgi:hypothetical protein
VPRNSEGRLQRDGPPQRCPPACARRHRAVASRSPEDFAAFLREDATVIARVIRESGAKFD